VPGGGAAVQREVLQANDRGVREGRAGVVLLAGDDDGAEARIDDLVARTAA
jgi:hypothetical protein